MIEIIQLKKADCTAEEWAQYLQRQREHGKRYYQRNREQILAKVSAANSTPEQIEYRRARWTAYYRRPDVTAKRKTLDSQPAAVARRRAYAATAAAKIRAKERLNERLESTPGLRDYRRNYGRLLRTGFTYDLVQRLLAKQENACAVCHRQFSETVKYQADHCHDSNQPRGLLCFHCNVIEGKLRAIGLNPLELGKNLHEYLEHAPAKQLV